MEKTNDAMTIYTLAKPDVVTIPTTEYKDLVAAQQHYETIVNLLLSSFELDGDDVEIGFSERKTIPFAVRFLEPEAYLLKEKQLRAKKAAEA